MGRFMTAPRFGEQRLIRPDIGRAHRTLYRLMGVGEPAHYLHHLYLKRALDTLGSGFQPMTILDAGCGSGDHTFYLARRYPLALVTGIDVDRELIERNRATANRLGLGNVTFKVASVEEPISGIFDLIVSIDVLEHLHHQEQALRNLHDALAPGGAAFFHIPTIRPRPVPFSRWLHDFHEWAHEEHVADDVTAEQFAAATRKAGFTTERIWRTFGYWTGELATSLFAIPYHNTPRNRVAQAALAPVCRVLALLDPYTGDASYAVGLLLRAETRHSRTSTSAA
jgi:2-polyprenyl-3-methyl-5-hydroxy-6-metoxy-1,4-benzoquinol methylase